MKHFSVGIDFWRLILENIDENSQRNKSALVTRICTAFTYFQTLRPPKRGFLHETATAGIVGLKINPRKTKTLRMNHRCTDYIRIEGEEVEDVESFVYLGSVLDKLGGTQVDIKRRLALARIAFTRLQNIWRSGRFSQKTKLRILNSNVLSVLLYGAEMWRVTSTDLNKVDVFHRSCLRRVLRRFWPYHLSNEELYKATGTTPVSALIRERRWRWIGHILRTSPNNISRTALTWAPEGKRRRGRPRETWRRTAEKERNQLGWHSWGLAAASAADRDGWPDLLAGLKSPHGLHED